MTPYWTSCYDFITKFCYTLNPHAVSKGLQGIDKFPDKLYLKHLVQQWFENRLLLVAKSRQMMVSWTFVACYLWESLAYPNKYTIFQSKKEEWSGFGSTLSLLSRAKFMYKHLPLIIQAKISLKSQKRMPPMLIFSNGSIVQAVAMDTDVGRTYTATGVLADELASQENARESMISIMPILGSVGRYTGVSTPKGKLNHFFSLVADIYSTSGE